MAPAPTATANRPMAQPSKTRYFKGKAPELAPESDSDSGEEEEEVQQKPKFRAANKPIVEDPGLVAGGAGRVIPDGGVAKALKKGSGVMTMDLGGAKIGGAKPQPVKQAHENKEEEETDDEEDEEEAAPLAKPAAAGDESSEYETDSEEESEEEKKPAFRPVFVRKDQRGMTQEKAAAEAEARAQAEEELQAQRKADSKDLAGETIRRELAEREVTDIQPDVDDTDGLDPAAEFDAWQARELKRLVRDKEAQAARDIEKEEIERRRAMPEDQRLREDLEFAQATRDREKGDMGFLQKYYHKGAFHQDDELLKRDYTAATESAVDMSSLPSVMQVRDFGKRSRTKYTHLVDQDTTSGGWGAAKAIPPGGLAGAYGANGMGQGQGSFAQGCWNCGGPHNRKDCPNNNVIDPLAQFGLTGQGSSSGPGGYGRGSGGPPQDYGSSGDRSSSRYRDEGRERRFDEERRGSERDRPRDNGYDRERPRDSGYDRDRPRDRDRAYERRERSRSPGRRRDDRDTRDPRGDRGDDRKRSDRDRDRYRDERDGDRERDRRR